MWIICNEPCSPYRQISGPDRCLGVAGTSPTRCYMPAILIDNIDFYHFMPLFFFTDLDLAWGSQGQSKAKPLGFIYLHTYQFIRVKFEKVLKQFKLNILFLSEILMKQGK